MVVSSEKRLVYTLPWDAGLFKRLCSALTSDWSLKLGWEITWDKHGPLVLMGFSNLAEMIWETKICSQILSVGSGRRVAARGYKSPITPCFRMSCTILGCKRFQCFASCWLSEAFLLLKYPGTFWRPCCNDNDLPGEHGWLDSSALVPA